MARESAGSVYVSVDGDISPLIAKYAQAEAQSRAAGQRIASGLGAGLQSASGIVDQFGRSVSSGITKPMETATPAVQETTLAIEGMGAAAHGSVTEIQAMSGALRTLDGNGGIRAAERFLATTLGLGSAVQAIFPLIGLIAVAELLDKVVSKFSKAHAQTEEFTAALKSTEQAARNLVNTLDDINVDKMRDAFGGAGGERMRAAVLEMQSFDKLTEAAGKRALIKSAGENENWITTVFGKPTDVAAVKQQIEQLSLEAQALAAQADEARRHANEVTGPNEAREAARKAEEERKRIASEAKREQEEAAREARVVIEGLRIAKRVAAEEEKQAAREQKQELFRGLEDTNREFENDEHNRIAAIVAETRERNRADQEQIKARGVRAQSDDEVSKLQTEQAYALQIVHTRAQELQYAKDIAAAEEKQLSDRIANLEALKEYQQINALYDDANRTDLEIERAKAGLRKQQIQDATRIAQLNPRFQLGQQVAQIGERIPGQLGGAIAGGVTGGNIGKQVADAIKGIGKDLLGTGLTTAIQRLIVASGVQALAERALSAIFGTAQVTNTAATTANTVATVTQTTAFITGTAADVAAMAALAAAVTANTAALLITGFIPGFATGGRPAPGVPYIVGENGPEVRIDDGPGVILPNVPSMSMLSSIHGGGSSFSSSSSSHSISIGSLHISGMTSPEAFARALPRVLKSRAPNFSPASR